MDKRKILIFGQPFNYVTGGGITLSNLFKGWPVKEIAVLSTGHELHLSSDDICDQAYQLGKEEYKWKFPFSLVQRNYFSGPLTIAGSKKFIPDENFNLRSYMMNRIFFPLMQWFGLIHNSYEIHLSEKLKIWLSEYNPDVLYIQVSSRGMIRFAAELTNYLKIRTAIHIMDDWPSTIGKGLFGKYWEKKIGEEFMALLGKMDVYFSISEAMSEVYLNRYGKSFIPVHNPVDIRKWKELKALNRKKIKTKKISLLYTGRIGFGITDSLVSIAEAVEAINKTGTQITFFIQTPSRKEKVFAKLKSLPHVVIKEFEDYSDLPHVLLNADLLLISCDFSEDGLNYLRLSMPTKATEYMISGSPIIVFASKETAVYKFFSKNECGFCIPSYDKDEIIKGILNAVYNESARKTVSENAVRIADKNFDSEKIMQDFKKVLLDKK
jgi:glycosyltransferase involved in cell wall biosynthesis